MKPLDQDSHAEVWTMEDKKADEEMRAGFWEMFGSSGLTDDPSIPEPNADQREMLKTWEAQNYGRTPDSAVLMKLLLTSAKWRAAARELILEKK